MKYSPISFTVLLASLLCFAVIPAIVHADYDTAYNLFKEKKYTEAIPLLEEWCGTYPKDPRGAYTLAQCYVKTRQNRKAIDRLTIILEHHPEHAPSQFLMGMLTVPDSPAKALSHFQRAAEEQPDNEQYNYFWGSTLMAEKRYDEAETALRKATKVNPKNAKAQFDLGRVLLFNNKPADSISPLTIASKGTDKASALFYLGLAQLQTKDFAGATDSLSEAAKLTPDDAKVFYNLGLARESTLGDDVKGMEPYDPVIEAYLKACALDKEASDYQYRLGNAYEQAVRKIYTQTAGNDALSAKALDYLSKAKAAFTSANSDAAKDRITGVDQMIENIKNPQIIEEEVAE
ncbi:tetratricopeptide repeat protein [bacterium]|nr:tetratricopeptide repeat protein [candidate division CSSED10-310 bacterium]